MRAPSAYLANKITRTEFLASFRTEDLQAAHDHMIETAGQPAEQNVRLCLLAWVIVLAAELERREQMIATEWEVSR